MLFDHATAKRCRSDRDTNTKRVIAQANGHIKAGPHV
jgi:hypothetical protein